MEKILLSAKRKKSLKTLASLLGDVGFNRIEYGNNSLTVEKVVEDLRGKHHPQYSIVFGDKMIEFDYEIAKKGGISSEKLDVLPILLNTLILAKDHYDLDHTETFRMMIDTIENLKVLVGKDTIDVASELEEIKEKYAILQKKYEDIIRSSEENSRLLLETEQRLQELSTRVQQLSGISDEMLRQELYLWIKMHGGSINIKDFAKAYSVSIARAEEGLEELMRERYIKKKA